MRLWLKKYVAPFLPGIKTYLVAWKSLRRLRPAHFRPVASWFTSGPPLLQDLRLAEADAINEASRRYFEQGESREFWLNRPFSDRPADPSFLWRFGLLAAALRIPAGARVLDFGCGSGWTSIMLARMGAEVSGVDVAPAALSLARQAADRDLSLVSGVRLEFRSSSDDRLDFPDEEFDFVVVFDAFHHLPSPRRLLSEFHRVLAPHGRFGFAEPGLGHAATASSRAEAARGVLEKDVDLEQLYRTALDCGFKGLEVVIPPLPPEILTLPMARLRGYLKGMTWLVPPDFLRKEILMGPMGVFRKSPYPVTSLAPRSHRARLRAPSKAIAALPGAELAIAVEVTNLTETVWLREGRQGRGYVRLGAQLLAADGTLLERDYGRVRLSQDVSEGRSAQLTLHLKAPPQPGRYRIRLDMVNEGVCWFAEQGSEAKDLPLDVRSPVV